MPTGGCSSSAGMPPGLFRHSSDAAGSARRLSAGGRAACRSSRRSARGGRSARSAPAGSLVRGAVSGRARSAHRQSSRQKHLRDQVTRHRSLRRCERPRDMAIIECRLAAKPSLRFVSDRRRPTTWPGSEGLTAAATFRGEHGLRQWQSISFPGRYLRPVWEAALSKAPGAAARHCRGHCCARMQCGQRGVAGRRRSARHGEWGGRRRDRRHRGNGQAGASSPSGGTTGFGGQGGDSAGTAGALSGSGGSAATGGTGPGGTTSSAGAAGTGTARGGAGGSSGGAGGAGPPRDPFNVVTAGAAVDIYVDAADFPAVVRAVGDLRADVQRVSGTAPVIKSSTTGLSSTAIMVGTLGKSPAIDALAAAGKLDTVGVAGKWESAVIQAVANPVAGVTRALVIAGSDRRGTVYGIYELSQRIGVSPWYWWADVAPDTVDDHHRRRRRVQAGRADGQVPRHLHQRRRKLHAPGREPSWTPGRSRARRPTRRSSSCSCA